MRHERILKRDDGSKVKITVDLGIDSSNCWWSVRVETCDKGKRKWINTYDGNDYRYRKLDLAARQEYRLQKQLEKVTLEEIRDTKFALVQQIPL